MMRLSILITLFVGLLAGAARATDDASQFEVSYWLGPPEKFTTLERYREIKDAGFTIAFPPLHTPSVELNRKILDLCQQTGLKAMIFDARMVTSLDAPDARAKLAGIVKDYGDHPALYGYFIVDEPSADAFTKLAEVVAYLKEIDAKHAGYINLFPSYAAPGQQLGAATFEEYVTRYVETVRPRVISYDHYPFVVGSDRADYAQNLAIVRNASLRAKIPFWQIAQIVQHLDYRHLTAGELRFQAMQTLAFGGKGLLWYTYWYPGEPNATIKHAMINYDGSHDPHYEMIKSINADAKAIGAELLRAESWAAYHLGDGAEFQLPPEVKSPVQIETNGRLTVGVFHHADGRKLALVANRDHHQPAIVSARGIDATFDPAVRQWTPATSPLAVDLAPGAAVLFRCSSP
ncbi:MAG: hypothetical protein QOF78_157 [Phycisphaerales bacterium]|jgi:hypothetical protein|nr:hypothetical protein [Phycisphaerales bacterium]